MSELKTASPTRGNSRVRLMAATALMTALTCVLAPLSIPIGPVPISFTNLAIWFSLYLLGWKLGTLSCLLYLLIGLLGLPVFSGFSGGVGKLLGPTGGFLIGFLPMALIGGLAVERFSSRALQFAGLAAGALVCDVLGTAWFCCTTKTAALPALSLTVFPFLPGDLAKILLAMAIGPTIRSRLRQAGVFGAKTRETSHEKMD